MKLTVLTYNTLFLDATMGLAVIADGMGGLLRIRYAMRA